jgi:hypothetical protein
MTSIPLMRLLICYVVGKLQRRRRDADRPGGGASPCQYPQAPLCPLAE